MKFDIPQGRPALMGILNVTPDSFSDGGSYPSVVEAVDRAHQMMDEGADIIDLGGESTRPGATPVSEQEEIDRVLPVLEKLKGIPVSIDTYKAKVAALALEAGAQVINDVSALGDPGMAEVASRFKAMICLMHRGKVQCANISVAYEVCDYLKGRATYAKSCGIAETKIWVDPGIGFGKLLENDIDLMQNLDRIIDMGYPVLVGLSRKRLTGALVSACENYESRKIRPVSDRLIGSVVASLCAAIKGAKIIRVHDVREMRDALSVWQQLCP